MGESRRGSGYTTRKRLPPDRRIRSAPPSVRRRLAENTPEVGETCQAASKTGQFMRSSSRRPTARSTGQLQGGAMSVIDELVMPYDLGSAKVDAFRSSGFVHLTAVFSPDL